jgi:hypothetical protein
MFHQACQQFVLTLKNLDAILDKAQKHAEAKKFDPDVYCTMRFTPDMFPLTRQVQIACDMAKFAAASLTGKEAPKHEDTEKTFSDVRARIHKCLGYLETLGERDFAGVNASTPVKLSYPQGKGMKAMDFLLARAQPNFFFHVTTTYALLRQAGVEIGKSDYLGALPMFDM